MPKQYLTIAGKTIIQYSLEKLLSHAAISDVVVVLHPQDTHFKTLAISEDPRVHVVIGGDERVDSVQAGLDYCQGLCNHTDTWVLVHDAARPCVSHAEIDTLLRVPPEAHGSILASPVVDTIKLANTHEPSISRTVDRTNLWQAQTPQFFPLNSLIECIAKAKHASIVITDEASAMEYAGKQVHLAQGLTSNIKITRPSDLALAEFYLQPNRKQM